VGGLGVFHQRPGPLTSPWCGLAKGLLAGCLGFSQGLRTPGAETGGGGFCFQGGPPRRPRGETVFPPPGGFSGLGGGGTCFFFFHRGLLALPVLLQGPHGRPSLGGGGRPRLRRGLFPRYLNFPRPDFGAGSIAQKTPRKNIFRDVSDQFHTQTKNPRSKPGEGRGGSGEAEKGGPRGVGGRISGDFLGGGGGHAVCVSVCRMFFSPVSVRPPALCFCSPSLPWGSGVHGLGWACYSCEWGVLFSVDRCVRVASFFLLVGVSLSLASVGACCVLGFICSFSHLGALQKLSLFPIPIVGWQKTTLSKTILAPVGGVAGSGAISIVCCAPQLYRRCAFFFFAFFLVAGGMLCYKGGGGWVVGSGPGGGGGMCVKNLFFLFFFSGAGVF